MRILILSPDFPLPTSNATRQRVYNLIRYLGGTHALTLLCFSPPSDLPSSTEVDRLHTLGAHHVSILPWAVTPTPAADFLKTLWDPLPHAYHRFRVRAFHEQIEAVIADWQPDVVHCEINMTEMIDHLSGQAAAVISPCDSFTKTYLRTARWSPGVLQRVYYLSQALKFYRAERTYYPRYGKCQVVSREEERYLRHLNPRIDTAVVPIGADVPEVFPSEAARRPAGDIVFSGQMSNPSTRDSVAWFVARVWPKVHRRVPECRLWLVGRAPGPSMQAMGRRDPSIVVTGFVEDMRMALRDKAVYVCPLRYGAGIKTRLLEAMANGLPVVTTSIGAEGVELESGRQVLIADTPEAFADATIALLQSPETRSRIAKAAFALVQERFTWRAYAQGMERLYEEAIRKHERLGANAARESTFQLGRRGDGAGVV